MQRDISRLAESVGRGTQASEQSLDAVAKLSAGLEELLQRQRRRQRHISLNSFVAYLLFTCLLGACFFLLYKSRVGTLVSERNRAVEARDTARARAQELQDRVTARRDAEEAAAAYHDLLKSDQHAQAVAAYEQLDVTALSRTEQAVFEEGVRRARAAMVEVGLTAGIDALRAGSYEQASAELRKVLPMAEDGRHGALLRYYLGLSLLRQGSPAEASRLFVEALDRDVEGAGQIDARFQLAVSLVQSGRIEEAIAAFDQFVQSFPRHRLTPVARRRAAQLRRPVGPAGALPAAGAQAAGTAVLPSTGIPATGPAPATASPTGASRAAARSAPPR